MTPITDAQSVLTLAIMSMDVYDRDPDPAHASALIAADLQGKQLGSATLEASQYDGSTLFGAAEYSWNGQTIIAYRGTVFSSIGTEAWDGYGVGAGSPYGEQATEAINFYQNVAKSLNPNLNSAYNTAGIVLTGHSLGGGLAGFIAALYGQQGVVFDNMPFELAASTAYNASTALGDTTLSSSIYGTLSPYPNILTGLSAYSVTGQVIGDGSPLNIAGDQSTVPTQINPYGAASGVQLHSMALLIALQWAQDNGDTTWESIGTPLLNAIVGSSSSSIATALGLGSDGSIPLTMIAYSALGYASPGAPASSYPFGVDAIQSLFTDADTLGYLAPQLPVALQNDPSLNALAEILVQHAGDLAAYAGAHNGVDESRADGSSVLGVMGNADPGTLTIDLSPDAWQQTNGGVIVGASDLATDVFGDLQGYVSSFVPTLTEIQVALVNGEDIDGTTAANREDGSPGGAMLIGLPGVGAITAGDGDNLIYGGETDSVGNGRNLIVDSGAGATFKLGAGADRVIDTAGDGTVDYSSVSAPLSVDLSSAPYSGVVDVQKSAASDELEGIENVTGSTGGDVLKGDVNANILVGNGANDAFEWSGGDDTFQENGSGFGTLDFSSAPQPVWAPGVLGGNGYTFDLSGGFVLGGDDANGKVIQDSLVNISGVIGSHYDDTFVVGAGNENIQGQLAANGTLDNTVVFDGARSQYEIKPDGTSAVFVQNLACGSEDTICNVGTFDFSDQIDNFAQLTAITGVAFASGGSEPVGASGSANSTPIGSIACTVANPDDTLTYALDPNDLSSQDFTLTSGGVLSLNPGVQVDEKTWLSRIGTLLNSGWNFVKGAVGEMAPNGSDVSAEVSPQQLLAGTPFEVTVDVNDLTTGSKTTQTLVIPATDAPPSGLAWASGSTPIVNDITSAGIPFGTLAVTDDDPSGWTFAPAAGSDPNFTIDPKTGVVAVAQSGSAGLDKGKDWVATISVVVTDVAGNQTTLSLPISVHHVDSAPTSFSVSTSPPNQVVVAGQVVATLTSATDPDPGDTAALKIVSVSDPSLVGRFAVDSTGKNIVVVGSNPLPAETINFGLAVVDSGGLQSPTQTTPIVVAASPLPLSLSLSNDTSGGAMVTNNDALKGTGEPGATVTFVDYGYQLSGSATIGSDGTFYFKPTDLLPDGPQDIVAYESDGVRSQTGSLAFTLDTTPPVVAINGSGGYVSSPSQTISGKVNDAYPQPVAIFDDGVQIASAFVQSDGSWSANLGLYHGVNDLVVQDTDMAGNVGRSVTDEIDVGSLNWSGGSTPTINEFPTVGSVVGTIAPNFGNSTTWRYSFTSETAGAYSLNGAFAINPSTGVVTVADGSMLDYNGLPPINLGVEITDSLGRTFDTNLTVNLSPYHAPPTGFGYTTSTLLTPAAGNVAGIAVVKLSGVNDVDQADGFRLMLVGDPTRGDFKVSSDGHSIVTSGAGPLPLGYISLQVNVVDGDGYRMATPETIVLKVTSSGQSQISMAAPATLSADGATSSADVVVGAGSDTITAAPTLAADNSVGVTQASTLTTPIGGDAIFDGGDWGNATTPRIHSSAATGDVFGSNSVRDEILRSQSAGGLDLAGGAAGRSASDIAQVGANVLNHPRFGDSLVDSASAGAVDHWKLAA
jgi:hypothetical protein